MKRRAFMGLGVVSIGVGSLYRTGAFSALSAGRGIAVTATNDPNGLLGIDNINTTDDPTFTNNTSQNMKVELSDIDPDTDITFESSVFSLPFGETKTIAIETADDAESGDVDITATLFSGGSADNLFEDGTKRGQITMQRDFAVPLSEYIDFTGEADSSGNKGDFSFNLINNNSKLDISLTGIGINATTTTATEVSPKGNDPTLSSSGEALVSESIPIDSTDPGSDTRRNFNFTLWAGETINFELYRFSNENGKVGMKNENVRITVYFEGSGEPKTFDLCLDNTTCEGY